MAVPQPSLSKTLPFWLANILWLIWPADLGMDCLAVETCGVHCVLKPATDNQRVLSSPHRAVHITATFACTVLQRFPSRHQCLVWTSFHTYSIYTVKATEDPPKKQKVMTNLMACAPGLCVSVDMSSPTVSLMISFLSLLSLMDTDSLSMWKLTFMSSNYKEATIIYQIQKFAFWC